MGSTLSSPRLEEATGSSATPAHSRATRQKRSRRKTLRGIERKKKHANYLRARKALDPSLTDDPEEKKKIEALRGIATVKAAQWKSQGGRRAKAGTALQEALDRSAKKTEGSDSPFGSSSNKIDMKTINKETEAAWQNSNKTPDDRKRITRERQDKIDAARARNVATTASKRTDDRIANQNELDKQNKEKDRLYAEGKAQEQRDRDKIARDEERQHKRDEEDRIRLRDKPERDAAAERQKEQTDAIKKGNARDEAEDARRQKEHDVGLKTKQDREKAEAEAFEMKNVVGGRKGAQKVQAILGYLSKREDNPSPPEALKILRDSGATEDEITSYFKPSARNVGNWYADIAKLGGYPHSTTEAYQKSRGEQNPDPRLKKKDNSLSSLWEAMKSGPMIFGN